MGWLLQIWVAVCFGRSRAGWGGACIYGLDFGPSACVVTVERCIQFGVCMHLINRDTCVWQLGARQLAVLLAALCFAMGRRQHCHEKPIHAQVGLARYATD
jgi:hypothetical protein